MTALGLVLPFVLASFGINTLTSEKAIFWATWLNAIPIFGFFVGAPVFGILSNKGRKKLYGIDVTLMAIGAFFQIFANSLDSLLVFRFIMGVGLGADYVLSPMILAESSNSKYRGRLVGIGFGGFWLFGSLVSSFVALLSKHLLSMHFISEEHYWKLVLSLGAIPPISIIYLRRTLPETPRFIAKILGDEEYFKELAYKISRNIPDKIPSKEKRTTSELLKQYWFYISLGAILWFIFDIPAYGQGFFISYISNIIGFNNPSLLQIISIGFTIVGMVTFWYLQPKLGSKTLQTIGFLGMGITFFIFAFMIERHIINAFYGIILFSIAKYFSQIGPGSIVAVGAYGVELVPTKIRGLASAINTIGGRLGVLLSTFVLPKMLSSNGSEAYYFMMVIAIIGAMLTLLFSPETANKGLEEITKEFD